jgi:lysyl oxidase-like protein 2/3/4
MFQAEESFYKHPYQPLELLSEEEQAIVNGEVSEKFFSIDGYTSRDLMPYPHDPLREPALWKKYDHLTIRQRLNMLEISERQKDLFETLTNSLGSASGSEIGFSEILRWYALAGHSMDGVWEAAGVYKLGHGGTTSLARSILNDYSGDILLKTKIENIQQNSSSVSLTTSDGRVLSAGHVVCTIPL